MTIRKDNSSNASSSIDLYIFFGPPGAGKTSQALLLRDRLNFAYVSWGAIWKQIVVGEGKYKKLKKLKIVQDIIKNPAIPFPPNFIKNIIKQEIQTILKDKPVAIILDGYPIRLQEAKELLSLVQECTLNIKALVKFNISFETIKQRISSRLYCPICYKPYNDQIRPHKSGICDIDGARLRKRSDDISEITKLRYDLYLKESLPAIDCLSSYSQMVCDVNAAQDDNIVFSELIQKLFLSFGTQYHIYKRYSSTQIETSFGKFKLIGYQSSVDYSYHVALVKGSVKNKTHVLTRIHSSCLTGDVFFSKQCDCGQQLKESFQLIAQRGSGIIIYLLQEGRGINILNKIKTYKLQRKGYDTFNANQRIGLPPDLRHYQVVKDILDDLKVKSIDILTNNPDKINQLQSYGVIIEKRVPLIAESNKFDLNYLTVKQKKFHHILSSWNTNKESIEKEELEIKFLFNEQEINTVRLKLSSILDSQYYGRKYEKTIMFDTPNKLLAKEDARLRVRIISPAEDNKIDTDIVKIELSYKKRINTSKSIKQEKEIVSVFETKVEDFIAILNKMNYHAISSYERFRETYGYKDTKITIDEFPFGYILEIEGKESSINNICKVLKLQKHKSYPLSCDDIYYDLCQKKKIKPKDDILFSDINMPHIS